MNEASILSVIREELARLAPEIEFDAVDRNQPIQREFDIDSMDFLDFITALHERLGVNVPESDYAKVAPYRARRHICWHGQAAAVRSETAAKPSRPAP